MQSLVVQNGHQTAVPAAVVTARGVVRRYGEGDTAVDCPARRLGRHRRRPPDRGHGSFGLRQVHAHAHPRRARQADLG